MIAPTATEEENARTACADGITGIERRTPYLRQPRNDRDAAARQPGRLSADRICHGAARRRCRGGSEFLCTSYWAHGGSQPPCGPWTWQCDRIALRRIQGRFASHR